MSHVPGTSQSYGNRSSFCFVSLGSSFQSPSSPLLCFITEVIICVSLRCFLKKEEDPYVVRTSGAASVLQVMFCANKTGLIVSPPPLVSLLTVLGRFLCFICSQIVRRWFYMWLFFCHCLFLIASSFGASIRLHSRHFLGFLT